MRKFNELSDQEKANLLELVQNHGLAGYYKFCIEINEDLQKTLDKACSETNPYLQRFRNRSV